MWEAIGWGVLVFLAAYGALTLLEPLYRAVTRQRLASSTQEQASFILKLREVPASKQEVSEMIDAMLAERLDQKGIELTSAVRREIRRECCRRISARGRGPLAVPPSKNVAS